MAGRLHIAPIDLPQLLPGLEIDEPLLSGANLAPARDCR